MLVDDKDYPSLLRAYALAILFLMDNGLYEDFIRYVDREERKENDTGTI